MNFKDIYRDANNELHGDEKMLLRLLSGNTSKKRSFKFSYLVPAAAALAVVAAIITAMPIKTVHEEPLRVATVVPEDEAGSPEVEQVLEAQPKLAEITPREITPPVAEAVAEPVPEEVSDESELIINYVDELGTETAAMAGARMINEVKELSPEEYAEYIGRNLYEETSLPEGLAFDEPMPVAFEIDSESGEVKNEQGVYLAHSEDFSRFAEITVSKVKELGFYGDYMQSEIDGSKVTVLSDGTDFNASFLKDEVKYLVRTGGLNEEELLNLLRSLNGGI